MSQYKQYKDLLADIESGKINTLTDEIKGIIVMIYAGGGQGFQSPYDTKEMVKDSPLEEIENAINSGFLYKVGNKRYMIGFDATTPKPTITVWDYDHYKYMPDAKIKWFDLAVAYVSEICADYCIDNYEYDLEFVTPKEIAIYKAIDWDGYAPVSQMKDR